MNRFILLYLLILLAANGRAQENQWVGPCYEKEGSPYNQQESVLGRYVVKKHKKKTTIEVDIRTIQIGSEELTIHFSHRETIQAETGILTIHDSYGIKFNLARIVENDQNQFLYKLQVFKKDTTTDCWRPLTVYNSFYEVYNQTITLNNSSIGYEGSSDYFRFVEGFIRLD